MRLFNLLEKISLGIFLTTATVAGGMFYRSANLLQKNLKEIEVAAHNLEIDFAKTAQSMSDELVGREACKTAEKVCCGSNVPSTLEEQLGRVQVECPPKLEGICRSASKACLDIVNEMKVLK